MSDTQPSSSANSFGGVCCVYDDPTWLAEMIRSTYDNVAVLLFLVGEKPWNGSATDNRETIRIIENTPDPAGKLKLIRGQWTSETEQRNAGLLLLQNLGIPYCFTVDADEIYDPLELESMQRLVLTKPEVGAWYMSWWTYWKSERYRIDPPEEFQPLVFLRIGRGKFAEHRAVVAHGHEAIPSSVGMCHHMSYARSDEEIARKISTFSHAHEIRPGWFEDIWLRWDSNHALENLHPVYPHAYRRAVEQPQSALPPVLRHG